MGSIYTSLLKISIGATDSCVIRVPKNTKPRSHDVNSSNHPLVGGSNVRASFTGFHHKTQTKTLFCKRWLSSP